MLGDSQWHADLTNAGPLSLRNFVTERICASAIIYVKGLL